MRERRGARIMGIGLAAVAMALGAPGIATAGAEPTPLGHVCKAENGVRFCPTETLSQRVPSFDGVPLDADVTLPPEGRGRSPRS